MVMLRIPRSFPVLLTVLLLSACNWGGKDDASDSGTPPPTQPAQPQRGALLTKPAPLVKSYSPDDLLALLAGSDVGKELLTLAYTPKCGLDVYQLTYETVGGKG